MAYYMKTEICHSVDESFTHLGIGVGMFLALYVEDKAGLKTENYINYKGLLLLLSTCKSVFVQFYTTH